MAALFILLFLFGCSIAAKTENETYPHQYAAQNPSLYPAGSDLPYGQPFTYITPDHHTQTYSARVLIPVPVHMILLNGNQVAISQVIQGVDGIYIYGLPDVYNRVPLIYFQPYPQVTSTPVNPPNANAFDTFESTREEEVESTVSPSTSSSHLVPTFGSDSQSPFVGLELDTVFSNESEQNESIELLPNDRNSADVAQDSPSVVSGDSTENGEKQITPFVTPDSSIEPFDRDSHASAPASEEESYLNKPTISKHQRKKQRKRNTAKKNNRLKLLSEKITLEPIDREGSGDQVSQESDSQIRQDLHQQEILDAKIEQVEIQAGHMDDLSAQVDQIAEVTANADSASESAKQVISTSESQPGISDIKSLTYETFLRDNPAINQVPLAKLLRTQFSKLVEPDMLPAEFSIDEFLINVAESFILDDLPDAHKANDFVFKFRIFDNIHLPETERVVWQSEERLKSILEKQNRLMEKYNIDAKTARGELPQDRKTRKAIGKINYELRADARKAIDVLGGTSSWLFTLPQLFIPEYAKLRTKFDLGVDKADFAKMLRVSQSMKVRFIDLTRILNHYVYGSDQVL